MRRITLTIVSTVAILVLLFAYKTSRNESVGTAAVTAADGTSGGAHIVSAPTSSSSADTGSDSITVPTTDGSTAEISTGGSSGTTTSARSSKSARPSTSTPASTTSAKSTPSKTSSKSAAPVVVDGAAIDTRYGPVQVEVTITDGKITDVTVPVYPQDSGRDQEINSQAIPILQQEVLAAQGAQIDAVSGATYTSDGFVSSLQSALDAAHFGQ